tara:strand:+ start:11107 stop:12444 length:1338 start_codon:yes stop_codon:yes gene_type:complete
MIGFETIGNATITVFDDIPVLTTDPWIDGNPYFGSWTHQYEVPSEQKENISKSKYIWLSHGHPDHIDQESFKYLKDSILLIPDHYGDRIFNFFNKDYKTIKLKSNQWFTISNNVRIKSFADWNQDASLIIEIMKKDIILNVNDGDLFGWKSTIKNIVKEYKNRFLLKLINWGDADMINFYDESGNFIAPPQANKPGLGKNYSRLLKNYNCNYAIPFSSMHRYIRSDSVHMNNFITPLDSHSDGFESTHGELFPAYIVWDSIKEDYEKIKVNKNDSILKKPEDFGDNYTDELTADDIKMITDYFKSFKKLSHYYGTITFVVGKKELNIKLSNKKSQVYFECPRKSLITAIKYEIFDDMLIGNFMKTTLVNTKSLYPYFTPIVTKYGDNGGAKSIEDLSEYFNYYKMNSANYWRDMLTYNTEGLVRYYLNKDSNLIKMSKNLKQRFF